MGAKQSKTSKNILTPSSSPSGSAENSQTRHVPAAAAAAATKPVTNPLHDNENVEDLDADACSIPESDASHLRRVERLRKARKTNKTISISDDGSIKPVKGTEM